MYLYAVASPFHTWLNSSTDKPHSFIVCKRNQVIRLQCILDTFYLFGFATSDVARIWCQEGHMQKLLGFTGGNCRHIVAIRLCTGQSALKKI